MASMRVGKKWLKRPSRTRLPRLGSIPRRASRDRGHKGGAEIVVDLTKKQDD